MVTLRTIKLSSIRTFYATLLNGGRSFFPCLFNVMNVNRFLFLESASNAVMKTLHTKSRKSLIQSLHEELDEGLGPKIRGPKSVDSRDHLLTSTSLSSVVPSQNWERIVHFGCNLRRCFPSYKERNENVFCVLAIRAMANFRFISFLISIRQTTHICQIIVFAFICF